jgi:hypothetical protein
LTHGFVIRQYASTPILLLGGFPPLFSSLGARWLHRCAPFSYPSRNGTRIGTMEAVPFGGNTMASKRPWVGSPGPRTDGGVALRQVATAKTSRTRATAEAPPAQAVEATSRSRSPMIAPPEALTKIQEGSTSLQPSDFRCIAHMCVMDFSLRTTRTALGSPGPRSFGPLEPRRGPNQWMAVACRGRHETLPK